ncbi:hypothetical protein BGZ99_005043 [Dissophora globulifera]|uniref:Yeast cell wall synthesis Kre9/Knh1-like N-terminal domain-containing protein n=1 Tax=Dissophora globulifera TaxID=979702 RepID=A0A9P6RT23_9FUNG|nr:hypothetical protein BGZ99_005043 [Dissophora globulifera]
MADLTLTSPNATSFVVAGGELSIYWTYSGVQPPSPSTISVELVDNSKKLFTGPLALFANLATTSGKASWSIPKLGYTGSSFSVILVANINGEATIFAQGPSFAILPEGTVNNATPAAQEPVVHSGATMTARWSLAGQAAVAAAGMATFLMHI